MALRLCLSLAALREFRLFPSGLCVTSLAFSVTGMVVTSSGGCEMQVDVGMLWDSSGKESLPLSPVDGGRNTTVWVGASDFGWKQEKIHILGWFESCLDRIASLFLCYDCIAVRILLCPLERFLRPDCPLQLTALTVGTQDNKHISFQALRGGYRKILMWGDCWENP